MAPIRKRTALRTRAERSARDPRGIYAPAQEAEALHHDPPTEESHTDTPFGFGNDDDSFRLNKKDKRTVKHNALLAKVRDAGVRKKKPLKRRRPTKKLKTDLGGLEDALPEIDESGEGEDDGWEGISEDGDGIEEGGMQVDGMRKARRRRRKHVSSEAGAGGGKMVLKSLKHKPGSLAKKQRMDQSEMERFKRNLAQMAGSTQAKKGAEADGGYAVEVSQQDRWAALRRFIGGTLEQDKAFATA